MFTNRVRSLLKSFHNIRVQLSIPFRWILLSSISIRFYVDLLDLKRKTIVKYLLVLLISLASIQTISPFLFLARLDFQLLGQGILETYPRDLIVTLDEGKLEINKPLPYVMHAALPNTPMRVSPYPLIIFATNEYISDSRTREILRPLVFLTESHLLWITREDYHTIKYPAIISNARISGEQVSRVVDTLQTHFFFQSGVFLLLAWVGLLLWEFIVGGVGYLLWIGVTSVIGWILAEWYTSVTLGYSTSQKVAVFALSLPLLIQIVLGVFRLPTLPWQLLYLVYLIWHVRILVWLSRHLPLETRKNTRVSSRR